MAKKGFTVHIDDQIIDDFRRYCNLNALKVSAKVEILLKSELEKAKINPTLVQMFQKILDGQKILRAQKESSQTKVNGDIRKDIGNEVKSVVKDDFESVFRGTAENVVRGTTSVAEDITKEVSEKVTEKITEKITKDVIGNVENTDNIEVKKKVPTIEHLRKMKGI